MVGVMFGVSQNGVMTKRRGHGDAAPYWSEPHKMWRAQIDVGYKGGKRQRKTVYGATKEKCQKKLNAARQAKDAGNLTTSTMRVDAWLRYWLDDIAALKVKPRTLADYRSKVETYLIPQIGRHRLDRLTPVHVRALHKWMRDNGKSETTITHTHWLLVGALAAAEPEIGLSRNVARQVDAPRVAKYDSRGLTPAECVKILDAAGDGRARWMFALYTGTRQGEALGLQWDRVDLENGTAEITWALQRVPYLHGCPPKDGKPSCEHRPNGCPRRRIGVPPGMEWVQLDGNLCLVRPKTARSVRVVDLAPGLVHALRALPQDGPNPHGLVWHRPDGRPIDGRTDYRAWVELLEKAKVTKIPLHGTRHTTATLMLAGGVPEPVQMQVLGHTMASTTRGYAHADRELTRAAMGAVADAIEAG